MVPPWAREVEEVHGDRSDVQFDYERALRLARRLWALADQVDRTMRSRQEITIAAREDFTGTYADQFAQRVDEEVAGGPGVAEALRSDAEVCARAWKQAMDEENRHLYGRHADHLKKQRSVLESLWDSAFGYRGFPPEPGPVPLPQPPLFLPTADKVSYP
jgi:hypothetical protein